MSETWRDSLIQEAKMQTRALQRLGVWQRLALSLAVIGILLAYTNLKTDINLLLGVFGIVMTAAGGGAAFLINRGRRNGKRNVEKILNVVTGE